jgi:hypothetical protein
MPAVDSLLAVTLMPTAAGVALIPEAACTPPTPPAGFTMVGMKLPWGVMATVALLKKLGLP